ncbi:MAG: AAA family ATPase [Endomicrobiia bacterium]
MYETFWGLKEKPFENTPDPKFFYNSQQHEEALARMLYVIREGKGAGLLTGVYGCGKTLLSRSIFKELEQDIYKIALITNPRLDDVEMLRMVTHSLGSGTEIPTRKADVLIKLENILKNNLSDGRKTVIIIDEAHVIEQREIFEEIRLLLNFQLEDKFLLTILLLGQPELKDKVEEIKQLNQRIVMKYHLTQLNREEVENYIFHRLSVAGLKEKIFSSEVIDIIFERSGGIPRRINQICDTILLAAYGQSTKVVTKELVKETVQSFYL